MSTMPPVPPDPSDPRGPASQPGDPAATRPAAPQATAAGSPPQNEPQKSGHSPWLWVSGLLAVGVIGLLIWGFSTQSDLNAAEEQNAALEQTFEQGAGAVNEAAAEYETAYNDLSEALGTTTADLEQAQSDVAKANEDAKQAEQDAKKAKEAADEAGNENDQLNAQADEARALADTAKAKANVASQCANAYIAAFGQLFEGTTPTASGEAAAAQLQAITAECKAALNDA